MIMHKGVIHKRVHPREGGIIKKNMHIWSDVPTIRIGKTDCN